MSNITPENRQGLTDIDKVAFEYGRNFVALLERWRLYHYAEEQVDFYYEAVKHVGVGSAKKILDIGTYDGRDFAAAVNSLADDTELYGIDPVPDAIQIRRQMHLSRPDDINFVQARSERLPFADNSMDGVLALFSAYHFNPLEDGLDEIRRVLKPGGLIAVSTSGKSNKSRQRFLENQISEYTGLPRAPIFTELFDLDIARELLPRWFEVVMFVPQNTRMLITPGIAYEDYIASLLTVCTTIGETPSDDITTRTIRQSWLEGRDAVAVPVIKADIERDGVYVDYIERGLFICRNNKP